MTCEVRKKEINSQCAELLVRPLYINFFRSIKSKNQILGLQKCFFRSKKQFLGKSLLDGDRRTAYVELGK